MDPYVSLLDQEWSRVAGSPLITSLGESAVEQTIADRVYIEFPRSGLSFVSMLDRRITTIQFYGESRDGYRQFSKDMPFGLHFRCSREIVHRILGRTDESGGGDFIQYLGVTPKWDRYDKSVYRLHLQYSDECDSITLLSLMSATSVSF
jgi:hypothetical protein